MPYCLLNCRRPSRFTHSKQSIWEKVKFQYSQARISGLLRTLVCFTDFQACKFQFLYSHTFQGLYKLVPNTRDRNGSFSWMADHTSRPNYWTANGKVGVKCPKNYVNENAGHTVKKQKQSHVNHSQSTKKFLNSSWHTYPISGLPKSYLIVNNLLAWCY